MLDRRTFLGAATGFLSHPLFSVLYDDVVKGSVTGSDLNPEKAIVVHDDVYIIADIQIGPGAKYQKLWQSMYIRWPDGAETPYTKGSGPGGTMTKAEKTA